MKSISTVERQPKWPGTIENKSKRISRKKKNLAKNGRKDKWCTAEERINKLKEFPSIQHRKLKKQKT